MLTAALPDATLLPLARPGARVRDVRAQQLPAAVAAGGHLATVLIGLNDVSRGGFCPTAFGRDLRYVVDALRDVGTTVLLGRLHDPCRQLPLPGRLRNAVQRRIAEVNAAVDDVAERARARGDGGDVHVLDLAAVPALRLRSAWAVDRLHPALVTHAVLAASAADLLREAGLPMSAPAVPLRPERSPSAAHEAWWLARHGVREGGAGRRAAGHRRETAVEDVDDVVRPCRRERRVDRDAAQHTAVDVRVPVGQAHRREQPGQRAAGDQQVGERGRGRDGGRSRSRGRWWSR